MKLNNMCSFRIAYLRSYVFRSFVRSTKMQWFCPLGYRVRIVGTSNYHSATKMAYLGYLYAFSLWVGHVWNLH
jgi:hypothetical protein